MAQFYNIINLIRKKYCKKNKFMVIIYMNKYVKQVSYMEDNYMENQQFDRTKLVGTYEKVKEFIGFLEAEIDRYEEKEREL